MAGWLPHGWFALPWLGRFPIAGSLSHRRIAAPLVAAPWMGGFRVAGSLLGGFPDEMLHVDGSDNLKSLRALDFQCAKILASGTLKHERKYNELGKEKWK